MDDLNPPRKRTRWAIRLPILFGAYHLVVFAASFFIPEWALDLAEFPAVVPLRILFPWVARLLGAALGGAPGVLTQFFLTVGLSLGVWMAYGWLIGLGLDIRSGA